MPDVFISRYCLRFQDGGAMHPVDYKLPLGYDSDHLKPTSGSELGCAAAALLFVFVPMTLFALQPGVWITLASTLAASLLILSLFRFGMNHDNNSVRDVWHRVKRNPPAKKPAARTEKAIDVHGFDVTYHTEHPLRILQAVLRTSEGEYLIRRKLANAYIRAGSPRSIVLVVEQYKARG